MAESAHSGLRSFRHETRPLLPANHVVPVPEIGLPWRNRPKIGGFLPSYRVEHVTKAASIVQDSIELAGCKIAPCDVMCVYMIALVPFDYLQSLRRMHFFFLRHPIRARLKASFLCRGVGTRAVNSRLHAYRRHGWTQW